MPNKTLSLRLATILGVTYNVSDSDDEFRAGDSVARAGVARSSGIDNARPWGRDGTTAADEGGWLLYVL